MIFNIELLKKILLLIVVILSLSTLGCSSKARMYKGEQVDSSKQAVIRVYAPTKEELAYIPDEELYERKGNIRIIKVDNTFTTYLFILYIREVSVLPGKHLLFLRESWRGGLWEAYANLWLVAEPGEVYIIKTVAQNMRVKTWIEKERTGEIVGGIVGSDDEPKS